MRSGKLPKLLREQQFGIFLIQNLTLVIHSLVSPQLVSMALVHRSQVRVLICFLLFSVANPLVQHDIPYIQRYCEELALRVASQTSLKVSPKDKEFQSIAKPILKEFPKLSISNETTNRFQLDYIRAGDNVFEPRYGSCSVPYLKNYMTCSFNLIDGGTMVKFYYLLTADFITQCMEDTSPRVQAYDRVTDTDCLLNFGSSCCIFDPVVTLEVGESQLPILVAYFSGALLIIAAIVYLFLAAMQRLGRKK